MAARQVFKGTGAELVDQLIEASQIRAPASSTYTGAGRELVPFFDLHEPVGNVALMGFGLEGPTARRPGNGARGSPRKAAAGRKDSHNKPESPTGSRNSSTSPSHRRANAGSPQPGRTSPRKAHKASSPPQAVPTAAPATSSAPAFRCPGFSQSPKPEMVPLPTFGLLQRAVARGIASSCKTSFSHGVSGMLPVLQVAA